MIYKIPQVGSSPKKVLVQIRVKIGITTGDFIKSCQRDVSLDLQGDGRPFWRLMVSEATGCADNDYFEEVYEVGIHLMHLF